ncbi:response regulator [Maribacter sp. CXY002]|uniref:response regulator n=1 Tax=Maribacter luteocoastalis TaxID=3407671 RepID=UPI003B66EC04
MKSLLAILLFFPSVVLFGQSNESITLFDSILEQSIFLRDQGKLDSALSLSKKLEEFPKQNISDELRIQHVTNLAILTENFDDAIALLTKEQAYQEKNRNYKNLAHIHYSLGGKYFESFNDRDALINFIKADSILQRINQEQWLAVMIKVGIANVLMKSDYKTDAEKFDQALPYINEGIALADSIDFPVGSSILLEKKGHYLQLKDSLELSLYFLKKALKMSQNINYTLRESSIYDGMGKVFFKQMNIDSATYYYEKRLELIEATDHSIDIAEANYNIGQFYNQVFKFQMAKKHLEKAWRIIEALPNVRKEYPYEIQNELAIAYSSLDEPKKALASLNMAKDLQEEVYNIRNSERISEVETKYRTEKKEQEIAILKSKNKLAEQQKKSQRNILIGGLGLTSLVGLFLFVIFRNRTKTHTKLKELDALKSNFFTNITHEFRTPLTLISSPIQEILAEPDLSPEKRSHFEMASRNTERLLSLVDQLLDLSKIDSGNRTLQLEKGKITQLIAAWSDSFSYLTKQKAIALDIDIQDKETEVWFDKDVLEKIIVNLLGNAIKYTPTKGEIKVRASIENNFLELHVKNTGQGLTKDEIDNIFNRFHQTNEQNEGAGIGLSLVKELTALHGGSISVKSVKDTWTSFDVTMCTDKSQFKNAVLKNPSAFQKKIPSMVLNPNIDTESEPPIDNGMPLLLIVEDNADVRLLLSDTFKPNFQVITAKNGAEGIELALEHIPDLIVSDVMMPIKDGVELTKTLKEDERSSHIPIVLLTAKAGDDNELIGLHVGADDYITKPFNKKLLLSKVNSLISLRKKLQLRYSQEVVLRPKDIAISSVDERFLEKVQRVLDENLIESSFNSEAFSKAVHMSRMQLHRKLKALTGLTTSEFVRSQRLKLATHLLKQSQINISEVGYAVGFNDHAYFTKCFRETYQCTPSEFVKKG